MTSDDATYDARADLAAAARERGLTTYVDGPWSYPRCVQCHREVDAWGDCDRCEEEQP